MRSLEMESLELDILASASDLSQRSPGWANYNASAKVDNIAFDHLP